MNYKIFAFFSFQLLSVVNLFSGDVIVSGDGICTLDNQKNQKTENQDRYDVQNNSENHYFLSVFDGHGGSYVSEYAKNNLVRNITSNQNFKANIYRAIQQGFKKTHDELDNRQSMHQGSTAVVAFVNDDTIYVANAGDSRAVVSEGGKAIALSNDHKPTPGTDEYRRIIVSGGKVINQIMHNGSLVNCGDRVHVETANGSYSLAMTRALGDKMCTASGVICSPEITDYKITAKTEFLIMASDGLWDVLENQDVVDMVSKNKQNLQSAAEFIVKKARQLGSNDDITAVVVGFKLRDPQPENLTRPLVDYTPQSQANTVSGVQPEAKQNAEDGQNNSQVNSSEQLRLDAERKAASERTVIVPVQTSQRNFVNRLKNFVANNADSIAMVSISLLFITFDNY